jgi:hypothetical protein
LPEGNAADMRGAMRENGRMSKAKDNNPSRTELIRLTARCKAAG